jgi:hypothetical protein
MPIFQDDLGRRATPPSKSALSFPGTPLHVDLRRRASEESIRTDLCEGLLIDSPGDSQNVTELKGPDSLADGVSDRSELIERLKRGESPTWRPHRHVCASIFVLDNSICADAFSIILSANNVQLEHALLEYDQKTTANDSMIGPTRPHVLLPAVEIRRASQSSTTESDALSVGLSIERPRSALHSGDFTHDGAQEQRSSRSRSPPSSNTPAHSRPPSPFLCTSPPRDFTPFRNGSRFKSIAHPLDTRSRAPSLSSSYSSSFVFKPPTSPLVQSLSNEDLDFSPTWTPIDHEPEFATQNRRYTFQPSTSIPSHPVSHLLRDNSYPYQAHQPRRSVPLAQTIPHSESSPSTPAFLRSRRPSLASDNSSLHNASMVGCYEESILRGRMSTTPSRPLDFVAQIGVLGLGKCKPNLKCPAHVTLPFPAVFYSYATTAYGRSGKAEDGPSPYVGQIDLENGLPAPEREEGHDSKRRRRQTNSPTRNIDESGASDPIRSDREIRRAQKAKRRSTAPKAPPGGSYRIPEKGQLQVIIKNPNKTAVKLFLVPYDLAGMEPGTKTFIRQRIYSAGPILEIPDNSQRLGPPSEDTDISTERGTLRYLIHLHICSPSRGRFYLYKSIRVVFANRVPDGKEKLKNEIQLPEPRFSVYKPARELSATPNALATEKAYRRRSSGFYLGKNERERERQGGFESMDGIARSLHDGSNAPTYPHMGTNHFGTIPVEPIPFPLFTKVSPPSSRSSRPQTSEESTSMTGSWMADIRATNRNGEVFDKLQKGDVGYGGSNGHAGPAEGLLAIKLKGLGVGIGDENRRGSVEPEQEYGNC